MVKLKSLEEWNSTTYLIEKYTLTVLPRINNIIYKTITNMLRYNQ